VFNNHQQSVELREDRGQGRQVLFMTMELLRGRRYNYPSRQVSGTGHRRIMRVVHKVSASLTIAMLLGVLAPHIVLAQGGSSKPFTTTAGGSV